MRTWKQEIVLFVLFFATLGAVLFAITSFARADNCRNVVRQNAVVLDTGLAIVPYAIPVAVPVVPTTQGLYSYNATAQAYQPRAATQPKAQSYTEDQKQLAEWNYWRGQITDEQYREIIGQMQAKASSVKAASVPPSPFSANCQKCHSQGGTGFAHHDFSKPLTSDDKLAAIDAIVQGTMPKGRKLDPQVRADIVAELSKREKQVKAAVLPPQPQGESK